LIGNVSFAPGVSVHVAAMGFERESHTSAERNATASDGKDESQEEFHPLLAIKGCAPAPALGFDDGYASTNFRKRPTVISYASSKNGETVAECTGVAIPVSPSMKVPTSTGD
jgi:hypothetical protein